MNGYDNWKEKRTRRRRATMMSGIRGIKGAWAEVTEVASPDTEYLFKNKYRNN